MEPQEIRERLLAHLRGAPEAQRYPFGLVHAKPLDEATEVSIARHRTGERRIYVIRRDPPKLLLRLSGNGEPLTATHFEPGDWLNRLPARAKSEPQKFATVPSDDSRPRRLRSWSAR